MSTRVIISAAGPRGIQRWNNHLGRPKHLIRIPPGGETLLRRTTRIVRELGIDDVVIVAPAKDPKGHTYETEGARIFRKKLPKRDHKVFYKQADRFLPRELWNTKGRTLFLPGDFYFTRNTLEGIVSYDPGTWVFFARVRTTTWPPDYSEPMARTRMILGFGFPAHEHELVMNSIEELTAMQRDPKNPVERSLGLDLYRHMCGQPVEMLAKTSVKDGASWEDVPPHLWQPPVNSADIDFDLPETYRDFMMHYQPELHS